MQHLKILSAHWSVRIMAICFGMGLIALFWGPVWAYAFIPLGVLAQMLNEYTLHRFVFHMRPPCQQWAFDLLYQAHYGHHDFPSNIALFFVPVWIALPMLGGNFLLLWALLMAFGVSEAIWIATAIVPVGGVAMFLVYEWFHLRAHRAGPKSAALRHVTRLHNQHHFHDFDRWYHVSLGGEIIDRLMGTAVDRDTLKSKQRTAFMRTLGLRRDDPRLVAARTRFASKYGLSAQEIARAAQEV